MRHRSIATIFTMFVLFAIAKSGGVGILNSKVALAQAVPVEEVTPEDWGLSSHPKLLLDARIESPARNDNVVTLPEKKAGDSIQFQIFVRDAAGTQIQGYTVELSLRGKTIGDYVDDVSGTDLNGDALLSRESVTGNPTLSMLSLSAVAVPANGYLGQGNLSVNRELTSSDVLAVSTASLAGPGGVQNLDVSVALLSFTQAAACPGDFDGDGTVGLPDFLALAGAFGSRSGDANYNALMDLDGSGAVDLSDFLAFAGVFGTECPTPPPPPPGGGDRDALVALYNATDGDNWRFNTNWLSDRPLGEWYGVTTDADGRVTKLELYAYAISNGDTVAIGVDTGVRVGNRLAGTIPSEVGSLTNLGHLDLSANQLTGTIPSDLGSLTNLQVLGLWNNQLTGPIPSELGRLTDLQALGLENNQLTGEIAPELGRLTNLQYLNLHGNQLTGTIPSELGNLSSLEWLALSANPRLTGSLPGTFTGLANLDFLFLENTGLCAPTDAAFQAWLQGIENKPGVVNCPTGSGGGGIDNAAGDFVLDSANGNASGITFGNGRFHVVDLIDDKVYAYTASGQRDVSADFNLDRDNSFSIAEGLDIAFANGRFHVVDSLDDKVCAYTALGQRDAAADFDLDSANGDATGITYVNGRFYVVDSHDRKVYAYNASGQRDAAADFSLVDYNGSSTGIAFANGRFYVVDSGQSEVFVYTAAVQSDLAANFYLTSYYSASGIPSGIAFTNGRFYVVHWGNGGDRVFAYTALGGRVAGDGSSGRVPDLVVQSPSVSDSAPSVGASFTLSATVRNDGDGDAPATTLRYYRSSNATISDSDTEVGTDAVGALDASGTSDESISLDAPSDAGTYYYGACVDAVGGEANAGNNCSDGVRVTVTASGGGGSGGSGNGACRAGLVVKPGERCTYKGHTFSVSSSGRGSIAFYNSGNRIVASGTVNGVRWNFHASKNSGSNAWTIHTAE